MQTIGVLGGVLVTGRADLAERLRFLQNAIGSVLGPFDSYLTLRGLKTLALRMREHSQNGCRPASDRSIRRSFRNRI